MLVRARVRAAPILTLPLALTLTLTLAACGDGELQLQDGAPPTELVHAMTGTDSFPLVRHERKVDVLLVIDNSSSMAEEQATLAANFAGFIEVLEHPEIAIDYRIAVTTTDVGNPACDPAVTTPERGALIASSCRERLPDFVADPLTNPEASVIDPDLLDARDVCTEVCTLDAAALARVPTTTEVDDEPRPRPWIERIDGDTNLRPGIDAAEALTCVGPQGVAGCSFEAPLEAMYQALTRTFDETDPSFGFLRHDAVLAVIFVTDEADCSAAAQFAELAELVELADGAAAPTSALCWDAGVRCEGDPSHYDVCRSVNVDAQGNADVDDADALLQPLGRYVGLLDGIEQQKRLYDPTAEVVVALVAGLDGWGNSFYADASASDPEFQAQFGIGPGCTARHPDDPDSTIHAVPPVRLRELTDAFTPHNRFSICEQDYAAALYALVPFRGPQLAPACFAYCAQDSDPSTALVEPACIVEERPTQGGEATRIQECERDADGYVVADHDYVMPADDVDVCYVALVDDAWLTESTTDDMSDVCQDRGHNLELRVARRPGAPGVEASELVVTCTLSEVPAANCPGLEGP